METSTKITRKFANANGETITIKLEPISEDCGSTEYEVYVSCEGMNADGLSIQTANTVGSAIRGAMQEIAWTDTEQYFYNTSENTSDLATEFAAMESIDILGDLYYVSNGDILCASAVEGYFEGKTFEAGE